MGFTLTLTTPEVMLKFQLNSKRHEMFSVTLIGRRRKSHLQFIGPTTELRGTF